MTILFANNAKTTVADSPLSIGSTTITVADGSKFPSPGANEYFYCTLADAAESVIEIVRCTSRTGNALTVVRGQDGTSAVSWLFGSKCEIRVCRAALNELGCVVNTQQLSGNGSTTGFTLSVAPYTQNTTDVFITGVKQVPGSDFTVSGTTLTFTTAPPSGTNNIFVQSRTPIAEIVSIKEAMLDPLILVPSKVFAASKLGGF